MVPSQVFEIVVRRYQGAIRRFLTGLTDGDSMLADDLAQDTFIKAFYAWDSFAALSSPKTWLMRIAFTTYMDYLRVHHVTEDMEAVSEMVPSSPSSQDLQMDMQQALQLLSRPERVCVQLTIMEDRSIKQVCTITGMNINTVKSHIKRGKEKIRTYLKTNGYDR
ncbi:MAG: sigma-70 family RNA polymerase sigma factor [Paludibacteraceae bacterium]|nr:sigma-70 family RNA polymerase sigma factor [Paludibacteraceae bacterium]